MSNKIKKITKKVLADWARSTGHSLYGPSSMARIIMCPGSVIATLNSPIPPESPYAAKGTFLHNCCEQAFINMPMNPVKFVNEQGWDQEDKVLVIEAIEYVLDTMDKHIGTPIARFEANGSLSSWGLPEVEGTSDVEVISAKRIDVMDYKFGYGVQVFAEENVQEGCYIGCTIPYTDGSRPDADIYGHIVQPTLNHFDDWKVEWDKLCSLLLVEIPLAIKRSQSTNPDFNPSMVACRFCNAKDGCAPRRKSTQEKAQLIIQASKNPVAVNKDKWRIILDAADDLQQAIKDVRIYAQSEIKSGRGFPGYKLVNGRSNRKFADIKAGEKFIIDKLGDDKAYAPAKVISLAQAEKVQSQLKKDPKWKKLITKPVGKPVLVKEGAKGEAIEYGLANEFMDDAAQIENINHVVGTDYIPYYRKGV